MGTIADKLSYLDKTRELIRTNINALGNDITEEDTFRSYADTLDEMWENQPQVSGTGERLTLNTKKGKAKVDLLGNTSQESTTGKNLWNILETLAGTTITTSDNRVYQLQTNTNARTYTINGEANTAYTVDLTVKGGTNGSDIYFYFVYSDSSQDNIGYLTGSSSTETKQLTKTSNSSKTLVGILVQTYNVGVKKDYTFTEPILVKGSTTGDYEPYTNGASPNPSYPQEIHSVSGDNVIKGCNKNLIGQENINSLSTATGTITGTTLDFTSTGTYKKVEWFIPIKTGDKFTFSCGGNDTLYLGIFEYSAISTSASDRLRAIEWDSNITSNGKTSTFTTQNDGYLRVYIGSSTATTQTLTNLQLERGETKTTAVEHKEDSYEIDLPVENLFDKDNVNVLNAYISAGGVITNNTTDRTIWLKIKKNTDYTFQMTQKALSTSTSQDDARISLFSSQPALNSSGTNIYSQSRSSATGDYYFENTFNSGNYEYVGIKIMNTQKSSYDDTIATIQLEESTKANHYTPYGTTPIELCKIGTYQDKFIRNSGKNLFSGDYSQFDSTGGEGRTYDYFELPKEGSYVLTMIAKNDFTPTMSTYLGFTTNGGNARAYYKWCVFEGQSAITKGTKLTITNLASGNYLKYVSLYSKGAATLKTFTDNFFIQIEEGENSTPYEPYGSGEWYLEKKIGKVVLDGTNESFTGVYGATTNGYAVTKTISNLGPKPPGSYSNNFKFVYDSYTNMPLYSMGGWSGSTTTFTFIIDSSITDLPTANIWLSTHNTEVNYVLSTPTYTKITGTLEEQLEEVWRANSYDTQTNISQVNNDLASNLSVTALASEE